MASSYRPPPTDLAAFMDEEDVHFYEAVRQSVLGMIFLSVALVVAYQLVKPFRRRTWGLVPFYMCVFVLSVAIMWLVVLAMALVVTSGLPLHWLISQWLSRHLVLNCWVLLGNVSSVCLFALAPFAYLYHESEGFGMAKGSFGRLMETLVVLSLLGVVFFGMFRMAYSIWRGHLDLHPFSKSTVANIGHYLPGLAIVLVSVADGFRLTLDRCIDMFVPLNYAHVLHERVAVNDLRIAYLSSARRGDRDDELAAVQADQREALAALHARCCCCSWSSSLVRNTVSMVAAFVLFLLAWHVVLRAVFNEIALLTASIGAVGLVKRLADMAQHVHATVDAAPFHIGDVYGVVSAVMRVLLGFSLGYHAGAHPLVPLSIDAVLCVFFLCMVLVGFRSRYVPTAHKADVQQLLLVSSLLLLVMSSLPVALWMLGLVRFDVTFFYPKSAVLRQSLLVHVYVLVFLGGVVVFARRTRKTGNNSRSRSNSESEQGKLSQAAEALSSGDDGDEPKGKKDD